MARGRKPAARARARRPRVHGAPDAENDMKLLLVEDDPMLAEGIAEFLRGQGDAVSRRCDRALTRGDDV